MERETGNERQRQRQREGGRKRLHHKASCLLVFITRNKGRKRLQQFFAEFR